MMKRISILVMAFCITAISFAQVNEVTLTVFGTGNTENEATLQALRSAIEQSFGTFVSANTTILNDKLVRDEIVSVSSGNIKEYQVLSSISLPNGKHSVSLTATVSIGKLISYCKSKGSKAEFSGQTFAANIKLLKLQVQSTTKAYELMVSNLEEISKNMFDFKMSISDPYLKDAEGLYEEIRFADDRYYDVHDIDLSSTELPSMYLFPISIKIYTNIASHDFAMLYKNTIENLKISKEQISDFKQVGLEVTEDIPIPEKIKEELDHRIMIAVRKATCRFDIYAIGDPSYHYTPTFVNEECRTIYLRKDYADPLFNLFKSIRFNETGWRWKEKYEHYYKHYYFDELLNPAKIAVDISNFDFRDCSQINHVPIFESFTLPIVKTRIELTKKQQKEVRKGIYTGPFYKEHFGKPTHLGTYRFYLYCDENYIEKVNGFELVVN